VNFLVVQRGEGRGKWNFLSESLNNGISKDRVIILMRRHYWGFPGFNSHSFVFITNFYQLYLPELHVGDKRTLQIAINIWDLTTTYCQYHDQFQAYVTNIISDIEQSLIGPMSPISYSKNCRQCCDLSGKKLSMLWFES